MTRIGESSVGLSLRPGRRVGRLVLVTAVLAVGAVAVGVPAAAPDRSVRPPDHVEHGVRILIDYFLSEQTPRHLILDRSSDRSTVSVSATGFGYFAWAVAAEDGLLDRSSAIHWINES